LMIAGTHQMSRSRCRLPESHSARAGRCARDRVVHMAGEATRHSEYWRGTGCGRRTEAECA
jgi:hypothetical protein